MPIMHTDKIIIGNACFDVIYKHVFFSGQKPLPRRLHCHLTYEVYCVEKGEVVINLESGEKHVFAPAVVVIPPKTYHILYSHSEDAVWYMFEFSLSSEGIGSSFHTYSGTLEQLSGPAVISVELESLDELRKYETLDEERAFRLKAFIGTLLIEVLGRLKKKQKKATEQTAGKKVNLQKEIMVANIIAYMEKNARGPLSLADVSKFFNFSERQIERLLKELMHDSFFSLLNKYRVHIAAVSIATENQTLTQVAEECGFSNYVTFWNHFTKIKGMTPSEYKKRVANQQSATAGRAGQ